MIVTVRFNICEQMISSCQASATKLRYLRSFAFYRAPTTYELLRVELRLSKNQVGYISFPSEIGLQNLSYATLLL